MKQKLIGSLLIIVLVLTGLTTKLLLDFVYFYPLFMSFVWITGGIYFYYHWERKSGPPDQAPKMRAHPFVSIIIPCFNEGQNVVETIAAACNQTYPAYEVIAVNDGSSDDTGAILDQLALKYKPLRVLHFDKNQGKAMGLRMGTLASRGEYLVCIDGDALMHPNAVAYLVRPMINHPRVGAVTGNPRVRNRATLLGKIQIGEFSSIIGLIKRAQRVYGNIFTISGVVAAFRKRALHDCGYWDINMVTEDIDISWSLQLKHWQIQYEPCAIVWILMPETFKGLWKQRLRWAQGGAEVYFKNIMNVWHWQDRRIWMLVAEFSLSSTWAFSFALSLLFWALGKYMPMPTGFYVPVVVPPAFWGLVLASVSLLQFSTALVLEHHYDDKLVKSIWWAIWYPLFFWSLSLVTTLVGIPRAVFAPTKKRALWSSSDRGFR